MKFGIMGAGSIGCYVGGLLAASGETVTLVGRPDMAAALADGLEVTRHDGMRCHAGARSFAFATEAAALGGCDVVLVCVKSGDTGTAAMQMAAHLRDDAVIVSLQNGVSNAAELRATVGGRTVLAAMVPFNVARIDGNCFHCGTQGLLMIEAGGPAQAIADRLVRAGLPAAVSDDIEAVLWGKLIVNLNNGVNALSGLPLKAQLSDRHYRKVLALSAAEGLAVLKKAGIRPARIGRVRPQVIPLVLRLPDLLFRAVAAGMLKVDDKARSSMADDLAAGRKPEIDFINGEIVRLGARVGVPTPVNSTLLAMVKDAFAQGAPAALSGPQLLARVAR